MSNLCEELKRVWWILSLSLPLSFWNNILISASVKICLHLLLIFFLVMRIVVVRPQWVMRKSYAAQMNLETRVHLGQWVNGVDQAKYSWNCWKVTANSITALHHNAHKIQLFPFTLSILNIMLFLGFIIYKHQMLLIENPPSGNIDFSLSRGPILMALPNSLFPIICFFWNLHFSLQAVPF